MTKTGIILCTVGNEANAAKIARSLVEKELAACVNTIKVESSVYRFEGKIHDEPELLLIIKTKECLVEEIKAEILELHEYTLPEIIYVPIECGHSPYIEWIKSETK